LQLNPQLSPELDRIINKALEKDRDLRYQTAAELRADLKRLKRDTESGISVKSLAAQPVRRNWAWPSMLLLAVLAAVAAVAYFWRRPEIIPPAEWQQITDFPDSAVQPSLSPDGHVLAFIRGPETFLTSGQIYLKFLPDGDPVQLTHDDWNKLAPRFSPDGSRVAYTVLNGLNWITYELPITGGEPKLLLPNAEGLTWIDNLHLLFSEVRDGIHMGVVTAGPMRSDQRDVYFPASKMGMAHFSYPSPDRKRVVIAEMNNFEWLPCRLLPLDGSSAGTPIGPPGACSSAAWSSDGKWIYLNSDNGGLAEHIWRVKFPRGSPEQITQGLTGEEGIALAPDGKSLITSVGRAEGTVWFHDQNGDRQISGEGYADSPRLTADGNTLFYLQRDLSKQAGAGQGAPAEDRLDLIRVDLRTAARDEILNARNLGAVSVSGNGNEVAYSARADGNRYHIWRAATNHESPPRQITPADQDDDQPQILTNGNIVFQRHENDGYFVYGMQVDGSGLHKLLPDPVLALVSAAPAGDVVAVFMQSPSEGKHILRLYRLRDGSSRAVCNDCFAWWSLDGKRLYASFAIIAKSNSRQHGQTYVLPWNSDALWKVLSPETARSEAELAKVATIIPQAAKVQTFEPGPSPDVYAYSLRAIQRNLYRVPLP